MNNTYKAFLMIILFNIILVAMMGFDNSNPYEEGLEFIENMSEEQLYSDNHFISNPDLTKDTFDSSSPTWSMTKGIQAYFQTMTIWIVNHGYTGVELTIVRIFNLFIAIINAMLGILIYRMVRGTQ